MTIKFIANTVVNSKLYFAGDLCTFAAADETTQINAGAAVSWPTGAVGDYLTSVRYDKSSGIFIADGNYVYRSREGVAASLPKTRAKLANIRAGVTSGTNGINGQLKVGIIGDSTAMGAGAGTSGTNNTSAAYPNAIGSVLATQFGQLGIAAQTMNFMGDQGMFFCNSSTTGYPAYDTRVTFGGTTAIYPNGAYRSLGGIYFRLNASTDFLTFNPGAAWDTAVIFGENGSAGTCALSINGGTSTAGITGTTTVTTANTGAASFFTQTVTITKASATLQIGNVTGSLNTGNPVIRGVWCYDSTTPHANIFNLGTFSQKLSTEVSLWNPAFAGDAYDLVIVYAMYINEITVNGLAGLAGYLTALQSLIATIQAAGSDVILCTAHQTSQTQSTIDAYCNGVRAFAAANNIPLIDVAQRTGSYTVMNANGLMQSSVHMTAAGYQDVATALGNYLIRA